MKSIALFGNSRTSEQLGKAATKTVRNEGKVPCVLYGGPEHVHFTVYEQDFKPLVYTPNTYKVKLDVDGRIFSAILKEMQFHPVNDSIMHADFMEINEANDVILDIPVKFVGNSIGVRQGGKLMVKSNKLKVRCLPINLPDFIEVNISELGIGNSIKVAEMKMDNITFLDHPNNPIVTIKVTRASIEEAAAGKEAEKKK